MTYRRFKSRVVVPLVAAAMLLGFGPQASHAGQNAADAFSMGWCLGVASYQAAVKQIGLANDAVKCAQYHADRLTSMRTLGQTSISKNVQSYPDLHAGLANWRERYDGEIRQKSNNAANAYRLSFPLGLAEGQSTHPAWGDPKGAWQYAHQALQQVQTLITTSSLSKLNFDRRLLNDALYYTDTFLRAREDANKRIVALRDSYRNVVLVSDY